ncbi:hypothetical protein Q8A73_023219 [Channa argus]|nr:hypothetical protein Q8A73_023219 [Channa argus]
MASEGASGEQPPPVQTVATAVLGSVDTKCEFNMDNLSKPELLTLLSIMEGELEARDLVIEALRIHLPCFSRRLPFFKFRTVCVPVSPRLCLFVYLVFLFHPHFPHGFMLALRVPEGPIPTVNGYPIQINPVPERGSG